MPLTPRLLVIACLTLLCGPLASAQTTSPATGFPQWGTFNRDAIDTVNVGNLNVHFEFPIFAKKGTGLDFYAHLLHDNTAVQIRTIGTSSAWIPANNIGWYVASPVSGGLSFDSLSTFCSGTQTNTVVYSNFAYIDSHNTSHALYPLNVNVDTQGCIYGHSNAGRSQDGWNISMTATFAFSNLSASVTDPSGNVYSFDQTQHQPTSVIAITDPNGNQITSTPSGVKDTAGYTVLTGTATSQTVTYTYPGPTGNVSVILNYTSFIQKTNFQCGSNVRDFPAAGASLPTTISMPDGTSYTIVYESTDGTYPSTTITGRIHSLTVLPTGSTATYTYSGPNNGIDCQLATPVILTKQTQDGTWTYNRTKPPYPNLGPSTVKVTDPAGNDTIYTFDYDGTHELQRVTYQGPASSNIVLQTTLTCYNGNFTGCNNKTGIGPVTQKDEYKYPGTTATAPSLSETLYNSTGQMTGDKEYDFGATFPPGSNFVRNTTTSYGSYSAGTCSAVTGIIDHPCSTITKNSAGTTLAQTNFTYNTVNGNLTNVSRLAGSTYLNSSYANNANGTVHIATDAKGGQTTYTYGACNGMYVTNISHPLSVAESMNWDCNGGAVISATDANSKTTTYSYINPATGVGDPFWRATQVNYPDGGQTTTTYNDTASPANITTSTLVSSAVSITTKSNFDGLGRIAQSALTSDPDGTTFTAMTYDGLGRAYQVYNPTRCSPPTTNCNESTWGYVTHAYDALGRSTQVTEQDGQTVTISYTGNCATAIDEAVKTRKSCSDALGRLTQVFEDPAGRNYETDYTYDALDNLKTVTQKGGSTDSTQWHTRTFNYDSLSRLLSASNPESGTSSYTYDANGNLIYKTSPAPNQTGSATVTLTYCYDALNRLTAKAYTQQTCSNGTLPSPVATYLYDQASYNGLTIANGIGRRTGMTDSAGSEAWSYDSMGRIATDQRTTNTLARAFSYTYNLDGSLATTTHPKISADNPLTITFTTGGAGRPLSEASVDDGGYAYNVHYAPNGALCYMNSAWGNTFTHIWTFNNRLQPAQIQLYGTSHGASSPLCSPSTDPSFDLNYSYTYVDANGHNNGNVVQIANGDWHRLQYFTYDSLNRIASAQTAATNQNAYQGDNSIAYCWGEQFGYDPWGNLLSISSVSSSYTGCTQESLSVAVNTKNQIIGNTYDAAGNLYIAQPGNVLYTYDAENHLTATGGQTYIYDGDGKRVEKATTGTPPVPNKLYWYDADGKLIIETDASGNEFYRYFYFAGRLVKREEANDWVDHYGLDALGNVRFVYGAFGANDFSDYYPFGGERVFQSGSGNKIKFTSKERDSESGNDNFGARYYSSSLGRFLSPDPENAGASPDSPQSWNAYSYVLNNPLKYIDPDGLDCAYLNDSGAAVEYIDHQGTGIGECQNNGGYWANGTIASASDVLINANQDKVAIFSSVNGQQMWSTATQQWTQGPFSVSPLPGAGIAPAPGISFPKPSNAGAVALPFLVCQLAEPCGGFVDTAIIGAALITGAAILGYDAYVSLSKGGDQNIVPTWAEGQRPMPGESGKEFAKRLCDARYGPGNYPTGPGSEFNKLKKWGNAHRS